MGLAMHAISTGLSAMRHVNAGQILNNVKGGIDSSGIMNNIPKIESVTSDINKWKMDFKPNLKIPDEVKDKVAPITKEISNIKVDVPASIGGVSLPSLPDLSSIANSAQQTLTSIGIDTSSFGLSTIVSLIKNRNDPSALFKSFSSDLDVDIPNMDANAISTSSFESELSKFDKSSLQSEIDQFAAGSDFNIDLSSYI